VLERLEQQVPEQLGGDYSARLAKLELLVLPPLLLVDCLALAIVAHKS